MHVSLSAADSEVNMWVCAPNFWHAILLINKEQQVTFQLVAPGYYEMLFISAKLF